MATARSFLFTSESVTEGHPDKVADRISDTVLDAYLAADPGALVACETLVTTGLVVLAGEISTAHRQAIDFQELVREAIREIGYVHAGVGFDADSCSVLNALHEQSRDIRQGVLRSGEIGAGDQGLMFGFACDETPEKMPLPIALAHRLTQRLAELRKTRKIPWLRPDGKAQVTVQYQGHQAQRLEAVVLSSQHAEETPQEEVRETLRREVIESVLPESLRDSRMHLHLNPTGRFVVGGPHGDCGLTGRKIIVDTYGGMAPHGGGAFSGKDPTKVDRSAAYMARYIAKNVVAAGLASRFQVQLAYAIGVVDPVGVYTESFGTSQVDPERLDKVIRELFPMTPRGLAEHLELNRPIYAQTSAYGHFGRELPDFTWEKTDQVEALRKAFQA